MSLIGRGAIVIPEGVNVNFNNDSYDIEVSGPNGKMKNCLNGIKVIQEGNKLRVAIDEEKVEKNAVSRLNGLYFVLLRNMITGVSTGFKKQLELSGIGYKANLISNRIVEFSLGYSHKILFCLPENITCKVTDEKGKLIITISGPDKYLVGQICSKIKSLRPVEPYKGKGFRYVGEYVKLKLGKKVKK